MEDHRHLYDRGILNRAFHKSATIGFAIIALTAFANFAHATISFSNGGFETTTNGAGQLGFNTTATGWVNGTDGSGNDGYNFLYTPGSADTTGATGDSGLVKLWGPNDGSVNGLPATSPNGGNYIAADSAYEVGSISQTITGLTKNQLYNVTFWWGAAQQQGFTGAQTDQWQVSFGSQTLSTIVLSNPNHGFTGWIQQTFTFKADSTTDVLSFLAVGTPTGVPPFALLDGVSVVASPEPGTWILMLGGVGLLAGLGFLRKKKRSSLTAV